MEVRITLALSLPVGEIRNTPVAVTISWSCSRFWSGARVSAGWLAAHDSQPTSPGYRHTGVQDKSGSIRH
jgi:hypothetical protein